MDEAVADISDGSTIMFPGFGNTGIPRNLMAALLTQGAKNLIGISNGSGCRDDRIDIGVLVLARQSPHPSRATIFNELYEAEEIEAELVTQGTMAERIRAAGAGIGAFYTPASVGTELAEGKEHRTIDGKEYVLEYPFHADYAFIRATRADNWGNLQFTLAQRNFNPIMAMAAKITIVEVEEDIMEAGAIDPDHVHTAGIFVDRIVKIPEDGIWDSVPQR